MLTLGLDPSLSSYGWVVYDGTKSGLEQIVERGRIKTDAKTLEVARYLDIKAALHDLIRKYDIKQCAMETPPVGSSAWSQEKLYALFIANMEVMYLAKVDTLLLAPSQLTLYAKIWGSGIVKGDWFKSDMVMVAQNALLDRLPTPKHPRYYNKVQKKLDLLREEGYGANPWEIIDLSQYDKDTRKALRIQADEADAFHAARCGYRFWEYIRGDLKEEDLTPSEWDLFVKTHTYTRGSKKGTTDYMGISFKEDKRFFRFATSS